MGETLGTLTKIYRPILASSVETVDKGLIIVTDKGEYLVEWKDCSQRLERASSEERSKWELSPSGYGIHWYLLDEDLSIAGLMSKAEKLE